MEHKLKSLRVRLALVLLLSGAVISLTVANQYSKAQHERMQFAKMTDTEHLKAASEAIYNFQWDDARKHLVAVKTRSVTKPSPDVPAIQGCASASTLKYSERERAAIDCTTTPEKCEVFANAEGGKELCPTERDILLKKIGTELEQMRQREEKEEKEFEAKQSEQKQTKQQAEQNRPDAWDSLPIEHDKLMTIVNAGYWQGGEYRVCSIEVSKNPTIVDCSDVTHRELNFRMDVVFDGSMEHAQWDCKRRQTDVYCKPYAGN
jgi:mRNA-degrading endonuclease RelE of RelBE toxin-antitoxin system